MQNYKEEISTDGLSWEECDARDIYSKNRKIKRHNKALDLSLLRNFLIENGFRHVVVHYQGCGDSGDCFYAEGYKKGETPEPQVWESEDVYFGKWDNDKQKNIVEPGRDKWSNMTHHQKELHELYSKFIKDAKLKFLEKELSWSLTDLIDYDWYNNEGGQGYIIWDLNSGKLTVAGQENFQDAEDVTEHIDMGKYSPEEVN